MKKKRSLSLIEVVISFSLLSLLLTTLFFWYHTLSKRREELQALKGPLLEERYAHQRLQNILPHAETPFLMTTDESLVFIFDRGPSSVPELSGQVLAKLYYDDASHCLCLGIWPKPRGEHPLRTPSQTLVLLDKVESCHFTFYHPPDPFKKPVDPREVGTLHPNERWQDEWKADFHALPALIKIVMGRPLPPAFHQRQIEYVFDLPIALLYPQEMI